MNEKVYVPYFPVLGVLGAVLVVLKLIGEIDLAWVWVLAPFWGPWALMLAIVAIPIVFLAVLQVFVWIAEPIESFFRERKLQKRLKKKL